MFISFKKLTKSKSFLKILIISNFFIPFYNFNNQEILHAGLEFQWDESSSYKKLRWHQKNNRRKAKNKIYFFLRPSDRKTGFIKLNLKIPDNFSSAVKEKKISLCKARIGGFDSRTKCLKDIPSDIEINKEKTSLDIFPLTPLPSSKDTYAIVFKVSNPQRAGLYQFHSFGQSSGNVPVSYYLGSYTLKITGS